MKRLAAATVLAGASMAFVAPAFATGGGHTPVLVCHDPVHHAVLITVDDDSTKLKGHLGHADRLGDVIEGVNGATAADVREACTTEVTVPGPTTTVSGPPVTVTVPGPTDTVTLPGDTTTITGPDVTETLPGNTTTVTGPDTTVTLPGSTSTTTLPDDVVTVPGATSTVTGEATTVTVGSTETVSVDGKVTTLTRTGAARTVVRDGKESLAFTGMDFGLVGLGIASLGGGVLLLGARRRMGAQH
jgi:hypothetical protein